MPTSQASLVYNASAAGCTPAALEAAMEFPAVEEPTDVLNALGCYVTSDVTTITGTTVTRTVNVALVPSVTATATAQIGAGGNAAPVTGLTVTNRGANYAAPPLVKFTSNGSGSGAQARSLLGVAAVFSSPGSGYSATPTVTTVGGRPATPATFSVTVVGGHILGIAVVSAGSGYQSIPKIVITDPTGSGAVATCTLDVQGFTLVNGGQGYAVPPTATLEPFFKALFPDTSNQAKPFNHLMTVALQKGSRTPIQTAAVAIT